METVLGKSCCMEGEFKRNTLYTPIDNIAEELCNRLERNGFERTKKCYTMDLLDNLWEWFS